MLIFSGLETLSYDRDFQMIGENFNFRNVDTIVLNGRFLYEPDDVKSDSYGAGFSYVSKDNNVTWVSFPDENLTLQPTSTTVDGFIVDDGNVMVQIPSTEDDLYFSRAVKDIWDDMDYIIQEMKDWNEIVIDGKSFGSGVVKSFNFDTSSDATQRRFSMTLELYNEGDASNLTGDGFHGFSFDGDTMPLVSSLSENFTFSKGKDGTHQISRGLNITAISGMDKSSMDVAKSLAESIINSEDPAFGFINFPSYYDNARKRYTESFDELKGEYSFNETIQKTRDDETFLWNYGISFSQDQNGISTVSENGTVVGLTSDHFNSARMGWDIIEPDIPKRVGEVYDIYQPLGLKIELGQSTITENKAEGRIGYTYNYSDDPSIFGCVRHQKTISFQKDQSNTFTVSERGNVIGTCGDNRKEKFDTALNYFKGEVEPNIHTEIEDFFDLIDPSGCEDLLSNSSSQITYSQYNHSVDYSYVYTNRSDELDSEKFYASRNITISDSVPIVGFQMTPYDGEVAQYQEQSTMFNETQAVTLTSKKGDYPIWDYVSEAKRLLVKPRTHEPAPFDYQEDQDDLYYLQSCNYTFSPDQGNFQLTAVYRYVGDRSRNEYYV